MLLPGLNKGMFCTHGPISCLKSVKIFWVGKYFENRLNYRIRIFGLIKFWKHMSQLIWIIIWIERFIVYTLTQPPPTHPSHTLSWMSTLAASRGASLLSSWESSYSSACPLLQPQSKNPLLTQSIRNMTSSGTSCWFYPWSRVARAETPLLPAGLWLSPVSLLVPVSRGQS